MSEWTGSVELRAFLDGIPALAWSALPDGSLEFCNQPFRDFTGLASDRLYGAQWKSAVHVDDLPRLESWWHSLGERQQACSMEARLRRFDGEYRWFQIAVSPVHDEQGNLVRWYCISTDIDARKCAEKRLSDEERDLRTITDAIRQSIVVLAPDGATIYANRAALELTGLTVGEVHDKGFFVR